MVTVNNSRPALTPVSSPPAEASHVVKRGDTLWGIAREHGVSLDAVIKANPQIKNPSLIHAGQHVNIPGQAAPSRPEVVDPPAPKAPVARTPTQGPPAAAEGHVTVKKGDTFTSIAKEHGVTLPELFKLNPHITDPSLIYPGERINLPKGATAAPGQGGATTAVDDTPSGPGSPNVYDGKHPAQATMNRNAGRPVDAPLENQPGQRARSTYGEVLDQFAVGNNPRYTPRNGSTYCNIFVSDATQAMGAPIPHWVDGKGNPAAPASKGAWEMGANDTNRWLHQHGAEHGWKQVSAAEAQAYANDGKPGVASWRNPGGIGHIAMVRPGEITDRGVAIAQAGAHNFNSGHLQDGFGGRTPEYWVHE